MEKIIGAFLIGAGISCWLTQSMCGWAVARGSADEYGKDPDVWRPFNWRIFIGAKQYSRWLESKGLRWWD